MSAVPAQRDRPAATAPQPMLVRPLHLLLRLLAVLVFAQPVFAGLFLDGFEGWRDWHEVNAVVILGLTLVAAVLGILVWRPGRGSGRVALAATVLFVATFFQTGFGETGQAAVHVPLGVAILGLIGNLLAGTRQRPPSAGR
jgi:hypothetical protein